MQFKQKSTYKKPHTNNKGLTYNYLSSYNQVAIKKPIPPSRKILISMNNYESDSADDQPKEPVYENAWEKAGLELESRLKTQAENMQKSLQQITHQQEEGQANYNSQQLEQNLKTHNSQIDMKNQESDQNRQQKQHEVQISSDEKYDTRLQSEDENKNINNNNNIVVDDDNKKKNNKNIDNINNLNQYRAGGSKKGRNYNNDYNQNYQSKYNKYKGQQQQDIYANQVYYVAKS